jgi:hypothetical protein
MKSKTSLSFTAEELEIIKTALNRYSVDMMEKSETWGKVDSFGNEDYYHLLAYDVDDLWSRFYKASKKLAVSETVTTTAE